MSKKLRIGWKEIGRNLRERREAERLGVRAAAKDLYASTSTYSRLENGKPVEVQVFLAACLHLGRNPCSYLLGLK